MSCAAASLPCCPPLLETRVEFMTHCLVCERDQPFIAEWECMTGLVGCCIGCGTPRIAPFTRAISEVA